MDLCTQTKALHADTSKGAVNFSYYPVTLRFLYDRTLSLICSYAWRFPKKTELVHSFNVNSYPPRPNASSPHRHLNISVGTDFFLKHSPLHGVSHITLADLNPNYLKSSAAQARRHHHYASCETSQDDFLAPDSLSTDKFNNTTFDTISTMMLLHCLPGPSPPKAAALVRLKHLLAEDGILFGATVLRSTVTHNLFVKFSMW